jgi:hypothetical protein
MEMIVHCVVFRHFMGLHILDRFAGPLVETGPTIFQTGFKTVTLAKRSIGGGNLRLAFGARRRKFVDAA